MNDYALNCDIHVNPGESFIDAVCRQVPARERSLSGLSLKILSARLDGDEESAKAAKEKYDRIKAMTNEEYEAEYGTKR